jgi:predicted DNA-binding transcriptional regulator AlpA
LRVHVVTALEASQGTEMRNSQAVETNAFSIEQFCQSHGISRAKFYLLRAENRAPREMKVGTRTLISVEAAEAWRRRMEAETHAA